MSVITRLIPNVDGRRDAGRLNGTRIMLVRILFFGTCIVSGCATSFRLPVVDPPAEDVCLLQYSTWGHHSVAFHRDDTLIEFTYGDWELFALDRRDAWTAWKNMTFPTPGALGRKVVPWNSGEAICPRFVGCERVVVFPVSLARSDALLGRLMEAYDAGRENEVLNVREDVYFVPYPERYSFHHNCNHVLVGWLEELGGEVSGRVFYRPTLIGGMFSPEYAGTLELFSAETPGRQDAMSVHTHFGDSNDSRDHFRSLDECELRGR